VPWPDSLAYHYDANGRLTLAAGLALDPCIFLSRGAIAHASFYLLDLDSIPSSGYPPGQQLDQLPWVPLGAASFDGDRMWRLDADMSGHNARRGYVVRFDFADSVAQTTRVGFGTAFRDTTEQVGVPSGPPSTSELTLFAYPNPATHDLSIRFTVGSGGPIALEIHDVLGRRLRTWKWTDLPAGEHHVEWDGVADDGHRVAPGVLFYRLTVAGSSLTRKLQHLR